MPLLWMLWMYGDALARFDIIANIGDTTMKMVKKNQPTAFRTDCASTCVPAPGA